MYKILNSRGLGVGGKQNELIELALTHNFNGVEVDMVDLVGRHDALGKQFACQFLQSAKTDLGTFVLPIEIGGTDEAYTAGMAKIDTIIDLATTLNAKCCYVEVEPNSELYSFQECFEKYQSRLQEISEKFSSSTIKIGLALKSSEAKEADGNFKFIQTPDELLTLIKAVGQPNVGLCLDAWEWAVGGGTVDQLASAELGSLLTEVRLADVSADADKAAIKNSDRTALPGDSENSFSVALAKAIISSGVEVPVSVSTDLSTYSNGSRNRVVASISSQLDLLIEGKDPYAIQKALEAESEEGEAAESSEEGEVVAAAEAPAATK